MKEENHEKNILKKIKDREVFKWDSYKSQEENEQEQLRKTINIAAEELHDSLDIPMRANYGELTDGAWENGINEITSITSAILKEHLIYIQSGTLKAKIGLREGEMPKYDK